MAENIEAVEAVEGPGADKEAVMEALVASCFEIISYVGTAKSSYIGAVSLAKEGKLEEAVEMVKSGDEAFNLGHDVHLKLLQRTAAGDEIPFTLILLHAEDQMATAETSKVMALDFIDVYRELQTLRG